MEPPWNPFGTPLEPSIYYSFGMLEPLGTPLEPPGTLRFPHGTPSYTDLNIILYKEVYTQNASSPPLPAPLCSAVLLEF